MDIPREIQRAVQKLKAGKWVNRVIGRDFLGYFGAERRGAIVVSQIREVLDSLDLRTDPDFETAWIGEPIRLQLNESVDAPEETWSTDNTEEEELVLGGTPGAVDKEDQRLEAAPISHEASVSREPTDGQHSDPVFRIGMLPAANRDFVTVNQSDSLSAGQLP